MQNRSAKSSNYAKEKNTATSSGDDISGDYLSFMVSTEGLKSSDENGTVRKLMNL
jgi:hypothetical protein